MSRQLRAGFVVTVSVVACSTAKPVPEAEPSAASATTTATATATATGEAPAPQPTHKKREVRNLRSSPEHMASPFDYAATTPLNPKDDQGRTIFTTSTGECYVHTPLPADEPPGPPGSPNVKREIIDCPEAMMDAAWDSCMAGTLLRMPNDRCVCNPTFGNPPPPPYHAECPGQAGSAVIVHKSFRGHVQHSGPSRTLVIKNDEELAAFVSTIPKNRIQKKQPAPPSDDPLLGKPAIDFNKHMLLVALRGNTMYVHPTLDVPRLVGAQLVVDVTEPPLGDTRHAAAMQGIGTYAAILIDRHPGEITFK